jgi:hypothetical protein
MVDIIKKTTLLTTKWMQLLPNLNCYVDRTREKKCRADEADDGSEELPLWLLVEPQEEASAIDG